MIGEMLRSYRKFAKVKFEGDWAELQPKFVCSDNPGQNIWHKVRKSSKIGQDF